MEAESACTKALTQHRSGKGYFRRARARKMLGRTDEAIRGIQNPFKTPQTYTDTDTQTCAQS
jgi:hypothetical protein